MDAKEQRNKVKVRTCISSAMTQQSRSVRPLRKASGISSIVPLATSLETSALPRTCVRRSLIGHVTSLHFYRLRAAAK